MGFINIESSENGIFIFRTFDLNLFSTIYRENAVKLKMKLLPPARIQNSSILSFSGEEEEGKLDSNCASKEGLFIIPLFYPGFKIQRILFSRVNVKTKNIEIFKKKIGVLLRTVLFTYSVVFFFRHVQLRPNLWPPLTKLLRDVIVALGIFIYRLPDYEAVLRCRSLFALMGCSCGRPTGDLFVFTLVARSVWRSTLKAQKVFQLFSPFHLTGRRYRNSLSS